MLSNGILKADINSIKRLFYIIGFTLLLLVFCAGCKRADDTVTIVTDISSYTPAMSSVRGITMTPDFKTKRKYTKLEYHWTAEEGEFVSDFKYLGKEVKNQGEAVLWSAIENDKVVDIENSFDIRLEVIDSEKQKVLANTKLTISPNKGFYEVKRQN